MKKRSFAIIALATLALSLTACGNGGSAAKTETAAAGEQAKAEVKEMKGDAIKKIVEDKKEKENYLIIDVRDAEEYAKGHINFAINMPLDTLKDHLSEIEDWKDKNVILYCNSGKMSGEAADILASMEKAKDALVVDAREAKDFEAGHFATAVNVNSEDPATIDAILPDDKNTLIITHCYSGNRSAVAAEYIASKGYTNVWNCLDGTKEVEYDFSKGDK